MTLFSPAILSRRGISAWLVLATGLLLTTLLSTHLAQQRQQVANQQFDLQTNELLRKINARLQSNEQILIAGAGLFDASSHISRAEWGDFIERMQLDQRFPGIQAVGFGQAIRPDQRKAHIAAIRAQGFPDYDLVPEGERSLYTSVVYLEPFRGRNLAAFGYDMYSEEVRRKAMQRAVASNSTTISGKVRLVQETHGPEQAGFLMYLPVYESRAKLETAEQRWQGLRGFVYSAHRINDLMEGVLGEHSLPVDFSIHDALPGDDNLLYTSVEESRSSAHTAPGHTARHQLDMFGNDWLIALWSRPEFNAQFSSTSSWLAPALGASLSVLLFAFIWLLLGRREEALALAEKMAASSDEFKSQFRQLFTHVRQGIVIHDANGDIIEANPAARNILGLESGPGGFLQPATGEWLAIREDGSDFPKEEYPVELAIRKTQAVNDVVMGVWQATQQWHWIRIDAYPNHRSATIQGGAYSVFSDITAERTADVAVRDARKLLADVFTAASEVAMIVTDCSGLISVFNKGAERMLGYDAKELIGKESMTLFQIADSAGGDTEQRGKKINAKIEGFRVLAGKPGDTSSESREWTFLHKDGHPIPVSLVVTPMRDDSGVITGYLGIAEDNTQRKQAEATLRDQTQHTQAILDNVMDAIVTIDGRGTINSFNLAAESIFGYDKNEVIGRNVKMLMPNPYRDAHDSYLRNYQETGIARIIGTGREVQGQRKDGSVFPMDLGISEIIRKEQPFYIGMVRDITERKLNERMKEDAKAALKQLNEDLEGHVERRTRELAAARDEAERANAAKSEFLSRMSHELRTPLNAILGFGQLLESDPERPLTKTQTDNVREIRHAGDHLLELVNEVLDLSRIESGRLEVSLEPVVISDIVSACVAQIQPLAYQRDIDIEVEMGTSQTVYADYRRLRGVLLNLLSNAVKYNSQGGRIMLFCTATDHQRLRISVRDTGHGIAAEKLGRLFRPFERLESHLSAIEGTGIGLALAKKLIEAMHGEIGVHTVRGEGSTFWFELPITGVSATATTQEHTEAEISTPTAIDSASHRVLYIEDNPANLRLVQKILAVRKDIELLDAATAETGLAVAAAQQPDLILLDLNLPGMDGFEALDQLRANPVTRDIPVIAVTANAMTHNIKRGAAASFDDYVTKPLKIESFLASVDRYLSKDIGIPE
ncbi:hypothetical protein CWI75_00890 [Kineobactrum sediminis]|uniref:Sensor protein FixL n=1 Tax=Kineobactrum sediminis TaxID=1905677 RepID=A0A2N5Y6C3_9GAMM|nr:CHASE domain-containing protein [Kineobactrum sediminis]PLW83945.1 hypothetical protein CWI75_00890 [Kineobactrum sediminis]